MILRALSLFQIFVLGSMKISDGRIKHGDSNIYSNFLSCLVHSNREFEDKKKSFVHLCENFRFEFLLLHGLRKDESILWFLRTKQYLLKFWCVGAIQTSFIKNKMNILKRFVIFHFHDEHEMFVYSCKAHPLIAARTHGMDARCTCSKKSSKFVCDFCIQVRYLLNFRAYKICVKKNTSEFLAASYFRWIFRKNYSLWAFDSEGKKVSVSLDNPREECMKNIRKID